MRGRKAAGPTSARASLGSLARGMDPVPGAQPSERNLEHHFRLTWVGFDLILALVVELPAAAFSLYVVHRVSRRVRKLAHIEHAPGKAASRLALEATLVAPPHLRPGSETVMSEPAHLAVYPISQP